QAAFPQLTGEVLARHSLEGGLMGGTAANGIESVRVLPPEEAFKVEQRGIDYIPAAERRGRPRDLFWMWTGTLVNIGYVVYGAVIISLGLSLAQAAAVI